MARPTTFGTWQWSVLATCAVAAIAFASAVSAAKPPRAGATARSDETSAAGHDAAEDAVVLGKRSRRDRPRRGRSAAPAAAPAVASVTHPPKALPSQPAPLAATPGAPSAASRAPSAGAARATSVEMQEATTVLRRARGESSL